MSAQVIAIDGPAASGKSTAAKTLARRLGIPYINTGSLYRAIAWKAAKNKIEPSDESALADMLSHTEIVYAEKTPGENPEIKIDGEFPGEELRLPETARGASAVAAIPFVREFTLGIQRKTAEKSMIVMEGRDIGTAVFPDARYKFFLTASPRVRALRRLAQNGEVPDGATVDSVAAEIAERDKRDSERAVAPLRQAPDATLIDSSAMTEEQVMEKLLSIVRAPVSATLEYRIPFADTDQMGVVYYANYLIYFEMARAELLRSVSFCYTEMEKLGYGMPVLEAVCHYKHPAKFEDKIVVTASLTQIEGVRVRIDCVVKKEDGTILADGWTVHACINAATGRPTRPPERLKQLAGGMKND